MIHVWAVRYSNYEPMEIDDTLWVTEELAAKRADELGSEWHPAPMIVQGYDE